MKSVILGLAMLMGVNSFANSNPPQKFPNCSKSLTTPKNGSGVFFNDNCTVGYVLPARTGKVTIAGFSKTTSNDLCQGIVSEQRHFTKEQKILQNKIERLYAEDAAPDKDAPVQCVDYAKKYAKYNAELEGLRSELSANQQQITSLASDSSKKAKAEVMYLQAKNKNIQIQISNLEKKIAVLTSTNSACKKQDNDTDSTDMDEKIALIRTKLNTLNETRLASLKQYNDFEGSTVQLLFEDETQKVVDGYKNLNSNLGVEFVRMPVNQVVAFSVKELADVDYKAILRTSVPGVGSDLKFSSLDEAGNGSSVFGGSLSGTVGLSLPATCFLADQMKKTNDISPAIAINSFYSYEVQSHRSYTVKYNMKHVYSFIKKVTSKSGLFRSSSSTEVKEFVSSNSVIDIKLKSDSTKNEFSSDAAFLEKLRGDILDQALLQLGARFDGLPQNGATPEAGATKVAGALSKCPNMYCQAGAIILNLTHALFGSSSSSASYLNQVDSNHESSVSDARMIKEYGSMGFVGRD